jgi:hypothetical protein
VSVFVVVEIVLEEFVHIPLDTHIKPGCDFKLISDTESQSRHYMVSVPSLVYSDTRSGGNVRSMPFQILIPSSHSIFEEIEFELAPHIPERMFERRRMGVIDVREIFSIARNSAIREVELTQPVRAHLQAEKAAHIRVVLVERSGRIGIAIVIGDAAHHTNFSQILGIQRMGQKS